jgi:DNA-binding MarR family transcriptional regulator
MLRKIHRYLHSHPDKAFSSTELADLLQLIGPDVVKAVETLEDIGAIDTRRVDSTFYHAYLAEIPDL